MVVLEGSKLTLANLQNTSDFDNLCLPNIWRKLFECHTCAFMCCCCSSWFGAIVFLRMPKITFFFERPSEPSTSNTSASVNKDLEPLKNKISKAGSISILLICF